MTPKTILSKTPFKQIIDFGVFLSDNLFAIFVLSFTNLIISYFVHSNWKYILMGINGVIVGYYMIRG